MSYDFAYEVKMCWKYTGECFEMCSAFYLSEKVVKAAWEPNCPNYASSGSVLDIGLKFWIWSSLHEKITFYFRHFFRGHRFGAAFPNVCFWTFKGRFLK